MASVHERLELAITQILHAGMLDVKYPGVFRDRIRRTGAPNISQEWLIDRLRSISSQSAKEERNG